MNLENTQNSLLLSLGQGKTLAICLGTHNCEKPCSNNNTRSNSAWIPPPGKSTRGLRSGCTQNDVKPCLILHLLGNENGLGQRMPSVIEAGTQQNIASKSKELSRKGYSSERETNKQSSTELVIDKSHKQEKPLDEIEKLTKEQEKKQVTFVKLAEEISEGMEEIRDYIKKLDKNQNLSQQNKNQVAENNKFERYLRQNKSPIPNSKHKKITTSESDDINMPLEERLQKALAELDKFKAKKDKRPAHDNYESTNIRRARDSLPSFLEEPRRSIPKRRHDINDISNVNESRIRQDSESKESEVNDSNLLVASRRADYLSNADDPSRHIQASRRRNGNSMANSQEPRGITDSNRSDSSHSRRNYHVPVPIGSRSSTKSSQGSRESANASKTSSKLPKTSKKSESYFSSEDSNLHRAKGYDYVCKTIIKQILRRYPPVTPYPYNAVDGLTPEQGNIPQTDEEQDRRQSNVIRRDDRPPYDSPLNRRPSNRQSTGQSNERDPLQRLQNLISNRTRRSARDDHGNLPQRERLSNESLELRNLINQIRERIPPQETQPKQPPNGKGTGKKSIMENYTEIDIEEGDISQEEVSQNRRPVEEIIGEGAHGPEPQAQRSQGQRHPPDVEYNRERDELRNRSRDFLQSRSSQSFSRMDSAEICDCIGPCTNPRHVRDSRLAESHSNVQHFSNGSFRDRSGRERSYPSEPNRSFTRLDSLEMCNCVGSCKNPRHIRDSVFHDSNNDITSTSNENRERTGRERNNDAELNTIERDRETIPQRRYSNGNSRTASNGRRTSENQPKLQPNRKSTIENYPEIDLEEGDISQDELSQRRRQIEERIGQGSFYTSTPKVGKPTEKPLFGVSTILEHNRETDDPRNRSRDFLQSTSSHSFTSLDSAERCNCDGPCTNPRHVRNSWLEDSNSNVQHTSNEIETEAIGQEPRRRSRVEERGEVSERVGNDDPRSQSRVGKRGQVSVKNDHDDPRSQNRVEKRGKISKRIAKIIDRGDLRSRRRIEDRFQESERDYHEDPRNGSRRSHSSTSLEQMECNCVGPCTNPRHLKDTSDEKYRTIEWQCSCEGECRNLRHLLASESRNSASSSSVFDQSSFISAEDPQSRSRGSHSSTSLEKMECNCVGRCTNPRHLKDTSDEKSLSIEWQCSCEGKCRNIRHQLPSESRISTSSNSGSDHSPLSPEELKYDKSDELSKPSSDSSLTSSEILRLAQISSLSQLEKFYSEVLSTKKNRADQRGSRSFKRQISQTQQERSEEKSSKEEPGVLDQVENKSDHTPKTRQSYGHSSDSHEKDKTSEENIPKRSSDYRSEYARTPNKDKPTAMVEPFVDSLIETAQDQVRNKSNPTENASSSLGRQWNTKQEQGKNSTTREEHESKSHQDKHASHSRNEYKTLEQELSNKSVHSHTSNSNMYHGSKYYSTPKKGGPTQRESFGMSRIEKRQSSSRQTSDETSDAEDETDEQKSPQRKNEENKDEQ